MVVHLEVTNVHVHELMISTSDYFEVSYDCLSFDYTFEAGIVPGFSSCFVSNWNVTACYLLSP